MSTETDTNSEIYQAQQHYDQIPNFQTQTSSPFINPLLKMDSEFWQQARGAPFGLHAAALASNCIQQQQQHIHNSNTQSYPSHFLTQTHSPQNQHYPNDQLNHQIQHPENNHQLILNAAAAAAAAAHLSGVAKSNEIQANHQIHNNIRINETDTYNEHHGIPERQNLMKSNLRNNQNNLVQKPQHTGSTSHLENIEKHQIEENSLQQQQSNYISITSSNNETFKSTTGISYTEFRDTINEHQQQIVLRNHIQNDQGGSKTTLCSDQTSKTHLTDEQNIKMIVQCQNEPLNPSTSPLNITSASHTHSRQQSLSPSRESSTPDTKFTNEKLHNETQLQLSRSSSAAAISERTLEECWSTLQRLFMHKNAMQQMHQIPRVGLGSHGSGSSLNGDSKPHRCQQCMKSFSSNHQLVQHIRVHTGEKPYKCSYCERRFKQLSHVQQHTRLHTGERPYKCHLPDCGRAFIQLSNLQQHLRNHDAQVERAKNRPFHCNICGKGFATESSLRTHTSKELQLHLGVLQQHAALIGGPNATSCPICHKLFLGSENLIEHMKYVHKEKAPAQDNFPENSSMAADASQGVSENGPGLLPTSTGASNIENLQGKRRLANHPCPICGKHYVNEGSLRKHLACHAETSQLTTSLRMWPCSVCQAVFTHENGLLSHMEHMRMDPKHQFAAQYVLSRAAAERRERDNFIAASMSASGGQNNLMSMVHENTDIQSTCHSPSGNSDCSSNERLSSSSSSEHDIASNVLNNNNNIESTKNNICNNNAALSTKFGDMMENNSVKSQFDTNSNLRIANRMSLMAVASAAAAAVASSENMNNSEEKSCVDSETGAALGNGSVQAAVVNLAAALRINHNAANSDHNDNLALNEMENQKTHEQQNHHLPQYPPTSNNIPLEKSAATNNHNRRNSPLSHSILSTETTSMNAMGTMNVHMIRSDPLTNINHPIDSGRLLNSSQPNHLQNNLNFATHSGLPILAQQQQHLQNPINSQTNFRSSSNMLHEMHQSISTESSARAHQTEAILRSQTEAAFRLAASSAPQQNINNAVNASGSMTCTTISMNKTDNIQHHRNNDISSNNSQNGSIQTHSTAEMSPGRNENLIVHDTRMDHRIQQENRVLNYMQSAQHDHS